AVPLRGEKRLDALARVQDLAAERPHDRLRRHRVLEVQVTSTVGEPEQLHEHERPSGVAFAEAVQLAAAWIERHAERLSRSAQLLLDPGGGGEEVGVAPAAPDDLKAEGQSGRSFQDRQRETRDPEQGPEA